MFNIGQYANGDNLIAIWGNLIANAIDLKNSTLIIQSSVAIVGAVVVKFFIVN